MAESLGLEANATFRPIWQVRPGMAVPMVLQEAPNVLTEGFWGHHQPPADFVPVHRILARKPFHLAIRNRRCALPANGFLGLREEHPFCITLLNHQVFCLGGIYSLASGIPRAALLQTSAPPIFDAYLKFLPVLIPPDQLKEWLTTEDVGRVMQMADRSQDHWFDYFRVSEKVLEPGSNEKDLLRPLGQRFSDVLKAQRKAQATVFLERRRRKGKG